MPVSQTEGYVVNLEYSFSEKHAFLVGFKKETSKKKRLLVLRQIPTQILLWKLLKATNDQFLSIW